MSGERVERRLAAVLAADIAGYSRLIGEDEEGTLAALRAMRREVIEPTIAKHRGRVVKTTGDGLLAEFQSAVDALRCATAWQAATAANSRIVWRIGIHQGDIVVEDGDILGDGVNVAARLEALAEPGGISVSARVQEDAAGRLNLEFEDTGEQALKNISRPVRVYRVGTERAAVPASAPALMLPDKPSISAELGPRKGRPWYSLMFWAILWRAAVGAATKRRSRYASTISIVAQGGANSGLCRLAGHATRHLALRKTPAKVDPCLATNRIR